MGKRGPHKELLSVLESRGSWRAKKRTKPKKFPERLPKCPDWFRGESRKKWSKLVKELSLRGMISQLDEAALARYCELYKAWVANSKYMEKVSRYVTYTTARGRTITDLHPRAKDSERIRSEMLKLEKELGLTPSSRENAQPESSDDDLDDLLNS
jgi:P27 family predicted phage terminase small subunit